MSALFFCLARHPIGYFNVEVEQVERFEYLHKKQAYREYVMVERFVHEVVPIVKRGWNTICSPIILPFHRSSQ